jgi:methionyl-tRNA formyltransferase
VKVLFFGTPEFAVPSLERLLRSSHSVEAVVTSRDKPRGRGLKLTPAPVKQVALDHGLPVLEPPNMKAEIFLEQVRQFAPDILVVVAFRILPKVLFSMPQHGAINVHPSLLPKYRGPAPIHWTLLSGETVTGATTFRLSEDIDAGNILLQREVPIKEDDDYGSLHDRLAVVGAELLIETLDRLEGGKLAAQAQDDRLATPAPKVQGEDAAIDWGQPARRIRNRVRAFSPTPGAWTTLEGRRFKIFRCREVAGSGDKSGLAPGRVAEVTEHGFPVVGTGEGQLVLEEVQMEGKRRMEGDEFVRGYGLLGRKLG